jgi:structure-specific endonuclease subunit SLX1
VAGDKFQPPSSSSFVPCQVEIIDVSTPSPDCRTSLYGKKRRVFVVSPEIIDLTKSPTFIQL